MYSTLAYISGTHLQEIFRQHFFAAAHDDDDEQERISKRNSTSQQDITNSTQFSD